MPNVEKMKDQLAAWGLLPQVWELVDAGYTLIDAIYLVHIAHTHNAYTASKYAA